MAVKKATSATKRGVPTKKTVPSKALATETVTRTAPRASAKTLAKAPMKTAVKASAKTAAKAPTNGTTTKVTATKVTVAKVPSTSPSARPQRLRVRANEKPWTVKELAAVRAGLEADMVRLRNEISEAELDLAGLMRDAGDGAGDDQADAGTATFEREQEISLANNAREMFEQSGRALTRIDDGSYGLCESCGSPIGKNRLLAFPRATLCLTCKSKQERR